MTDRIPPGFSRDAAGRLLVAGRTADAWVAQHGSPLFVYDRSLLAARVAAFHAAMPAELELHYALKANPMPAVVGQMAGLVDGFDVASAGEMALALAAGMAAEQISFAGPGKRDAELAAAIAAGVTLHIKSTGELARAGGLAQAAGVRARVALRVNPPFALKGSGMKMGGLASPFGVDAADAPALLRTMAEPCFDFVGFHIFAGSQNLSEAAILDCQRQTVALVAELATLAPCPPRLVNLGGGFGVPYFAADRPLDVAALGDGLAAILAQRPAILAGTRFAVELGRWLVAEAGVYLTQMVDRKTSGGETFLITDGGLHHQLAASGNFGTVIRRNYPLVNASRNDSRETATVVGCLCTPLDRLADKAEIASAQVGDIIAVFMAGAYGRTASPERFLGHPPPAEILA